MPPIKLDDRIPITPSTSTTTFPHSTPTDSSPFNSDDKDEDYDLFSKTENEQFDTSVDRDDLYEDTPLSHLCQSATSNQPYGEEVEINQNTMEALSIFVDLWHPSIYKGNSAHREGFSLFALFNQCSSTPGRAMMKNWFLHPVRNLNLLRDRLDLVELFADNANFSFRQNLTTNIKRLSSIRGLLYRMRITQIDGKDWCKLYTTLMSMGEVVRVLSRFSAPELQLHRTSEPEVPLILKLARRGQALWTFAIRMMGKEMERVVNFEMASQYNRFEVNEGIDAEIDNYREQIREIAEELEPAIEFERERFRQIGIELQPESCVTFMKRIGFLLKVDEADTIQLQDLATMELMFKLDNSGFFKTPNLRSLDEKYGDPHSKIDDIHALIMYELQEKVLPISEDIERLMSFCSELDCHITMGEIAQEHKYCRPTFTDKGIFDVRQLRHPLAEHVCQLENFVTNDFVSGSEMRMKIITGPNSSGKSVYLKSVCLITFMAHIGSFVPAKSANLPVVDKILTRIKSIESISSNVSAFVSDIKQMNQAYEATANSLVAIDEFGKGTQPSSGVALLAASANYWIQQPVMPHVLIATHFLSLQKILQQDQFGDKIHYQHFRVRALPAQQDLPESPEFQHTYQLYDGHAESSMALYVAKLCGCDPEILERARVVNEMLKQRQIPTLQTSQRYGDRRQQLINIGRKIFTTRMDIDREIKRYLNEVEPVTTHRKIETESETKTTIDL